MVIVEKVKHDDMPRNHQSLLLTISQPMQKLPHQLLLALKTSWEARAALPSEEATG
jgi:cell division protein FtsI/penicillin-binding protein 2